MTATDHFYQTLEPFEAFEDFADFSAYTPLPEDWVLLVGDIRGSTRAIADGRYKAVNMLGAAVITAVLNVCDGLDVPFVFGGDGGAIAVPASRAAHAREALQNLQTHAQATFDLSLRAAAIPVARLRAEGFDVAVRRMRLNGSNYLAMFAGGGVERADVILKGAPDSDPDILQPGQGTVDLEGLSCRWEPLAARRGQMIALMVQPVDKQTEAQTYRDTLDMLRSVLDGRIMAHAPARDETLRFRWPPRGLLLEARTKAILKGRAVGHLCWGLFTAFMQKWCHWRGVEIGGYDGPRYLEELKSQTDFRKFDGCLRTVLDCTPEQASAIESWLEDRYQNGNLIYGLHADKAALMTCLVFSFEDGQHMHFVDAAGGGFARAAEGFKTRLASLPADGQPQTPEDDAGSRP